MATYTTALVMAVITAMNTAALSLTVQHQPHCKANKQPASQLSYTCDCHDYLDVEAESSATGQVRFRCSTHGDADPAEFKVKSKDVP